MGHPLSHKRPINYSVFLIFTHMQSINSHLSHPTIKASCPFFLKKHNSFFLNTTIPPIQYLSSETTSIKLIFLNLCDKQERSLTNSMSGCAGLIADEAHCQKVLSNLNLKLRIWKAFTTECQWNSKCSLSNDQRSHGSKRQQISRV